MRFHSHGWADCVLYNRLMLGEKYRLSPNFQVWEIASKDGTFVFMFHPVQLELLENIRKEFGSPVRVNSGFRTHCHNKQEGGAGGSDHIYGMGSDIDVIGVAPKDVQAYCRKIEVGGLGSAKNFTHVGIYGRNRRWTY